MTSDPDDPGRWPRDSKAEDDEAHRATELARLEVWIREQKLRPLTDALEAGGVQPGNPGGESWAGQVITPAWFNQVPEPHDQCPWCQRPGIPAPCPECRQGHAAEVDPPSLWSWWQSLTPAQRRLQIAARFGTDPWTGRRVTITAEWTDTGPEGTDTDAEATDTDAEATDADTDTDTDADAEASDADPEGWISTGQHRYTGCTPDGIYWAARRRA